MELVGVPGRFERVQEEPDALLDLELPDEADRPATRLDVLVPPRQALARSDGRIRHCAVSTLFATNATAAPGASAVTSGACDRATTQTRDEARSASASTPRRRIENAPTSMSLPRSA